MHIILGFLKIDIFYHVHRNEVIWFIKKHDNTLKRYFIRQKTAEKTIAAAAAPPPQGWQPQPHRSRNQNHGRSPQPHRSRKILVKSARKPPADAATADSAAVHRTTLASAVYRILYWIFWLYGTWPKLYKHWSCSLSSHTLRQCKCFNIDHYRNTWFRG